MEKFQKGLKQPSILKQLQSILDQYPDDGQILKELLQNAEDAKAKNVKFVYDENSYGVSHLPSDFVLSQFQGEALFAYNDAVFEADDWDGIRRISGSVKEKDPLKVGRFGLGFKSVFHITDLPSVLSGEGIGFLDPHKLYLPEKSDTHLLHLKQDHDELQTCYNITAPFMHELFRCFPTTIESGYYEGTLFRFPIRSTRSELSSTVYSKSKIIDLFGSFIRDADQILLFLNHIESVELYILPPDGADIQPLYTVCIAETSRSYVCREREEFLNKIKTYKEPVTSSYAVTIQTTDYREVEPVEICHTYLITQHYSNGAISGQLHRLCDDETLSYLPWVSSALSLEFEEETSGDPVSEEQYERNWNPTGNVFCFLPLPLEKKSPTGFHFHVNGYLAVDQNRRHIKWPEAVNDLSSSTDKALLWNHSLITELLPHTVKTMLITAIGKCSKEIKGSAAFGLVCKAIPDEKVVDERWKMLLGPLYKELFQEAVIFTEARGGQWVMPADCILCKSDQQIIQKILVSNGDNAVFVPYHVVNAITKHTDIRLQEVSPGIVSSAFRKIQTSVLTREEKLSVLRYLLEPCCADLLFGLDLLPLADGTFTKFRAKGQSVVYITSAEFPREIFPGLENLFVDSQVQEMLRPLIHNGRINIEVVNGSTVVSLIGEVVKGYWHQSSLQCNPKHLHSLNLDPSIQSQFNEWLRCLWEVLLSKFPTCLNEFRHLPLLPTVRMEKVYNLSSDIPLILESGGGLSLTSDIIGAIELLGVTVINDLPTLVKNHPALIPDFVLLPTSEGVIKAIHKAVKNNIEQPLMKFDKASAGQRDALRQLVLKCDVTAHRDYSEIIKKIPVFQTTNQEYSSIDKIKQAAPSPYELPVWPPRALLLLQDVSSRKLFNSMKVDCISTGQLLVDVILPVARQHYAEGDFQCLMKHVMINLKSYGAEDKRLYSVLKQMEFVAYMTGEVRKPCQLFDPSDQYLTSLFLKQNVFPALDYTGDIVILQGLKTLGLKQKQHVEGIDILSAAGHIEQQILNFDENVRKANSIMFHLNSNPSMLETEVNGRPLRNCLACVHWVPVLDRISPTYPKSLKLCETTGFQTPNNVTDCCYLGLVGSVLPVFDGEGVQKHVKEAFGWLNEPSLKHVIAHLGSLVTCYDGTEKGKYMDMLLSVYDYLTSNNIDDTISELHNQAVQKWIWNGDGFSDVYSIVLNKHSIDFSPLFYTVLPEMCQFKELFSRCGVADDCDPLMVLEKIRDKYDKMLSGPVSEDEALKDLQLCISILHYIRPTKGKVIEPGVYDRLLVPIDTDQINRVQLVEADKCSYMCDHHLLSMVDSSEEDFHFIHPYISNDLAEALNIRSFTSQLLNTEELDLSFGQGEPLTRRLHTLLNDYRDGTSVIKELIQNADDAGASEVKILYDERTNDDAVHLLLDPGMAQCQGPALWIYNDAVFTEEDFVNITKLNGATKEKDIEKIGRFGLGFNAVYNLTDVPSFVSRDSIVIFDPHTIHLGRMISNKLKPGIRLNFVKKSALLHKYRDQFSVYRNVFGFDMFQKRNNDGGCTVFNGTLFRLPLRTENQAKVSEISQLHYDRGEVKKLLNVTLASLNNMLLFTQNVRKLEIYHLPDNGDTPDCAKMVFFANKTVPKVLRWWPCTEMLKQHLSLNERECLRSQCCALKAVKFALETDACFDTYAATMIEKLMCRIEENSLGIVPEAEKVQNWAVCYSMGGEHSQEMARKDTTLLPIASVAARITVDDKMHIIPESLADKEEALVYCFMPLPIETDIPVHINACFSVMSSRLHLSQTSTGDKDNTLSRWNDCIMKDGVCRAYLHLLGDMTREIEPSIPDPYILWPANLQSGALPTVNILSKQFYMEASNPSNHLKIFSDGQNWVGLEDCVFLDPDLRHVDTIGQQALDMLRQFCGPRYVIDLPKYVRNNFELAECIDSICKRTVSVHDFYSKIVLPHIDSITRHVRDSLILYAICTFTTQDLKALLEHEMCVPVNEQGDVLIQPNKLIHPLGKASKLFTIDDHRFPHFEQDAIDSVGFPIEYVYKKLEDLGMQKDALCWGDLQERCNSVSQLECPAVQKHVKLLLRFIISKCCTDSKEAVEENMLMIRGIPFLTLEKKPSGYPIPWKGDQTERLLFAADELYHPDLSLLIGSVELIVDQGLLYSVQRSQQYLRIKELDAVSDDQLSAQLNIAQHQPLECFKSEEYCVLGDIMKAFYKTAANQIDTGSVLMSFIFILKIFQQNRFFEIKQVAFNYDGDSLPYLTKLDVLLRFSYQRLFRAIGVKEEFDIHDFTQVLQSISERNNGSSLDKHTVEITCQLLKNIAVKIQQQPKLQTVGMIFIPDSTCVMRPVREVCYRSCPWFPEVDETLYCHPGIPYSDAEALGIETDRDKYVNKRSFGLEFGQREKLSVRLKHILEAYPCGREILQELLQNADDSGATEIHFVLDPRHHGVKRTFCDSWNALQGPALCVYNNKPFSEADIQGIQELGEGSKEGKPFKIGKFGVGFNCVYHITDVPSILTWGSETGETLCVFDPNLLYVPYAEASAPGRRYTDVSALRKTFPDVFTCFLPNDFDIENATMFRLPLRSKEMAAKSCLSRSEMTVNDLRSLMKLFKENVLDSMLFLHNIQKVSISEIDVATGSIVLKYCAESQISHGDRNDLNTFKLKIEELSTLMSKCDPLQEVNEELYYKLMLSDSDEQTQTWLIVQKLRWNDNDFAAFLRISQILGKSSLLPLGAVAALLGRKSSSRNSRGKAFQGIAYCGLPLPVETDLPVHVNGQFALDHEGRRQLWYQLENDYRVHWNNKLLNEVIAPAYVSLLCLLKNDMPDVVRSMPEYLAKITDFKNTFPLVKKDSKLPYWNDLCRHVYKEVCESKLPLLPVIRKQFQAKDAIMLDWVSPINDGLDRVFFPELSETRSAWKTFVERCDLNCGSSTVDDIFQGTRCLLQRTNFNLVDMSPKIYHSFINSDIHMDTLSPSNVIEHFRSRVQEGRFDFLSKKIECTPFQNVKTLQCVLLYCVSDRHFRSLSSLPFLLAQDGVLREFTEPVFISPYWQLFQRSSRLFLHHQICDILKMTQDKEILKEPGIEDISSLMSLEIPQLIFTDSIPVPLYSSPCVEGQWLAALWLMIYHGSECQEKKITSHTLLPLNNFAIVPAIRKSTTSNRRNNGVKETEELLIYVTHSSVVLNQLYEFGSSFQKQVGDALIDLGMPRLDTHILPLHIASYLSKVTAETARPESILNALDKLQKHGKLSNDIISPDSCRVLLEYFQNHIAQLKDIPGALQKLSKLPIYCTISGTLTSLWLRTCFVLSDVSILQGLSALALAANIIFLHEKGIKSLLKNLECYPLSKVDLYCRYVIPNFRCLDPSSQSLHLNHMRESELYRRCEELEQLEFIPGVDGKLQKACNFYDKENEVFQVMQERFPPSPFDGEEWQDFLKFAGLKTKISNSLLVEYAKRIATEFPSDFSFKQSQALVAYFKSNNVDKEVLIQLKSIKFIVSDEKQVCIAYAGSVIDRYRNIARTSTVILPDWATPPEHYIKHLDILHPPSANVVVNHCINLCSTSVSVEEAFDEIVEVLNYLSENYAGTTEVCQLREVRCIPVREKNLLTRASRIVINLMEEDQIPPYLLKLPIELGTCVRLLKSLGTKGQVNLQHYADVLQVIHKKLQGRKVIESDLLEKIRQAQEGFFKQFARNPDSCKDVQNLYLLSKDFRLVPTTEVVMNDIPSWQYHLEALPVPLLSNFELPLECKGKFVTMKGALLALPQHLKVEMISGIVSEELREEPSGLMEYTENEVKDRILSDDFLEGLMCLVKNALCENNVACSLDDDSSKEMIVKALSGISVYRCDSVKTCLVYKDCRLQGSDDTSNCLVSKTKGQYLEYKIYVTDTEDMLLHHISRLIKHILFDIFDVHVNNILSILTCKPYLIFSVLEGLGIDIIDSMTTRQQLPILGGFIPVEDHHLLKSDFEEFQKGEYVGYEIYDHLSQYDADAPTYIYAQIVENISMSECGPFQQMYKIKISDHETRDAVCTDLYKFVNPLCFTNTGSNTIDCGSPFSAHHIETIKNEIHVALTNAWQLPKGQREKIIKRLYLKWHPAQNFDKDICREILKFIRHEVESLQRGCAESIDDASIYSSVEARAISQGKQREAYGNMFRTSSHGWSTRHNPVPPSFAQKNPQKGEAKRWLRQAQEDLRAAQFDHPHGSYEWTCFKCHQAAEKALKACHYTVDARHRFAHELQGLASGLDQALVSLAGDLERLLGFRASTRMRYPDNLSAPSIPHDVYNHEHAENAITLSQKIYSMAEKIVNS